MKFSLLFHCFLCVLSLSVFSPLSKARIPVIFDTDLGTDIDDTWALAQLLRSPELEVKLVLSDAGDTRYRATLIAKFFEIAGRSEIPIGIGHNFGPMGEESLNQAPWIKGYELAKYPGKVHEDGIGAFIDLVRNSPETLTLIAIGPVPNIAKALERAPDIASKLRFVGMHGSFRLGYGGSKKPAAEANVAVAPAALRTVLGAPWKDVLLTPLDTCGLVSLKGDAYQRIWSSTQDPLLRALIENYCIFAPRVRWMHCDWFATASTTLFDSVAVYLAYDESLVNIETLRFDISDDGYTRLEDKGPFCARVATSWKDQAAFERHLAQRLLGKE